ncbi:Protein-N(5)-glutamine methyltransferase PrmC, methylates polypeptide chain release factors RF1 and RF2 [hydrothermal vent metagenome]|uniref:peptide chain release factor N(5)-glutamine methyltransferase n=1 Tax=hydrothermal vent metagenome TaxID=652676 RepID=A0A1W1EA20_9ZZZZ
MTLHQALKEAQKKLQKSCERPQFEAELLLAHHLGKERTYLILHPDEAVEDIAGFEALVARRAKHEPYEYIVGKASFYDVHLKVAPGVLIPRPETELLIDHAAKIIEEERLTSLAEIGVGSGAISIMLARKFPHLYIIATDICDMPLKIAAQNAKELGVGDRIALRKSNLLDEVSESVEIVVSNPPYIAEDALLEANVAEYEPKEALFGGRVGDELLKQIILEVKQRGIRWLVCEMGYDQKMPIQAFVNEVGVKSITFYKDLAGHDRGFVIAFF